MQFLRPGRACGALALALREGLALGRIARVPEPEAMRDIESVAAFHRQGSVAGSMLPVYHFNALALSRLLPRGGALLDLGCGSGQILMYLAERRPDLKILGLDLSAAMVEVGAQAVSRAGLGGRVRLRVGDMIAPRTLAGERFDAVSCLYALHHLPSERHLRQCLAEIARLRARYGCGVWIFDHARPRSARTARRFPEVFSPEAPLEFRRDSGNSLLASFSFGEMRAAVEELLGPADHALARLLPVLQAHWLEGGSGEARLGHMNWVEAALPAEAERTFRQLRRCLPDVELGAPAAEFGAPEPVAAGGS